MINGKSRMICLVEFVDKQQGRDLQTTKDEEEIEARRHRFKEM